jgi:hypothetical protein
LLAVLAIHEIFERVEAEAGAGRSGIKGAVVIFGF